LGKKDDAGMMYEDPRMSSEPVRTTSEAGSAAQDSTSPEVLDLDFFHRCFDAFPDPVMVMDTRNRVVFLNDAARCLTGQAPLEESSLVSADILRMDGDDTQGSLFERCLGTNSLKGVPVHVKDPVGDWLPFSLTAQLACGKYGKPAGCVAIVRDVLPGPAMVEDHLMAPISSSIIDNFPMPFFTVDTDLTITYMNHDLEGLTGYSKSEVVNRMTCAELLRTDHCHTQRCAIKYAMENRRPLAGLRFTIRDREGRSIPVAAHVTMLTDAERRVIGGFEALRDITPLLEAEEKIRMLAEVTQEGILMADESQQVIFANSKMAEILEQGKDELTGKDVGELLPLQHLNIINDLGQKVDSEHPQQLLFCSTIQPAKASAQPHRVFETCIIVSRFGKSATTYMFFHDLTKHIEIERQLHEANSFLSNIIRSSADGIVVVGKDGKVLIFNEGAERILGYSAEEVVGNPLALFNIYSPEAAREIMRRMRSDDYGPPGKLTSLRISLVTKSGEEVPVNFSAALIEQNEREIGSVGIFSDLRERIRIRKELEDAKMQLMQAEKIASVGRLAAGVAHEINNPLSGILLYADMLMKDLAENPQWSADMQEIIDQTLRCKEIVTRLLEFSRQSVGQRVPFEVNLIIKRSAELLARQSLFHDVELVIDLQPDIPQMMGDPGQLQQVFTNFIINAGSAMNGKGKIVITSRFDPECEEVSLQFADTGPGIAPEIMDKIFEPFFTTKRPGEGTGLGLSVAYGIIQQHGGHITVKNAHSGGAIFTVTLPLECPEDAIELTC
jgi:two-component system, NtrC family, sensor kinase